MSRPKRSIKKKRMYAASSSICDKLDTYVDGIRYVSRNHLIEVILLDWLESPKKLQSAAPIYVEEPGPRTSFVVRLHPEFLPRLDAFKNQSGFKSRNAIVVEAIAQWLERNEK